MQQRLLICPCYVDSVPERTTLATFDALLELFTPFYHTCVSVLLTVRHSSYTSGCCFCDYGRPSCLSSSTKPLFHRELALSVKRARTRAKNTTALVKPYPTQQYLLLELQHDRFGAPKPGLTRRRDACNQILQYYSVTYIQGRGGGDKEKSHLKQLCASLARSNDAAHHATQPAVPSLTGCRRSPTTC